MRIENDVKLDFQDVLIRPKRSQAASRSQVDLTRTFKFRNSKNTWTGIPLIAANMDTVATFPMAKALIKHQICTALHKHYSEDQLVEFYKGLAEDDRKFVFHTMGVTNEDIEKFKNVCMKIDFNVNVCVDVANAYTQWCIDRIKYIRDLIPCCTVMAGNVATPEMVQELILAGVDIVKVGLGGGGVCITRKITGIGYPQLSAALECAEVAHGLGGHIVSDGGCTMPGDVAKAFGAGADFVMLGSLLSGHAEGGGEIIEKNGEKFVKFYGMSSKTAMDKYHGGVASYRAAEGKTVMVPYKGLVDNTVQEILGGLRSACTYVGAMRLKDLSKCTTFIRVNQTHNRVFSD